MPDPESYIPFHNIVIASRKFAGRRLKIPPRIELSRVCVFLTNRNLENATWAAISSHSLPTRYPIPGHIYGAFRMIFHLWGESTYEGARCEIGAKLNWFLVDCCWPKWKSFGQHVHADLAKIIRSYRSIKEPHLQLHSVVQCGRFRERKKNDN